MNARTQRAGLTALLAIAIGLLMIALPASAAAKDRNHDRIPDRWEKHHGLSLKVKQTKRDQDADALNNRHEFVAGDDPRDADSDNDGVEDGDEGAGTIASFDGTTLTIALFDGGTVSGTVTDQTEVKCDNGDDQGDEDGDGEGGHSGPGGDDHSGPGDGGGDEEVGDDDSVDEEAGDDDSTDQESVRASSDDEDTGDDETGDDEGDDADETDDEQACSVDDLVQDATVQEADLVLANGSAVFSEIELAN